MFIFKCLKIEIKLLNNSCIYIIQYNNMSRSSVKSTSNKTKIPRNFLLLDALNKTGNYTNVTYGLVDENENDEKLKNNYIKMEYWNCTMVYDDGNNLNVFEVSCRCGLNYPQERPILTFSKESLLHKTIKKRCDPEGNLTDETALLTKWNENMLLGDYLSAVLKVISGNSI